MESPNRKAKAIGYKVDETARNIIKNVYSYFKTDLHQSKSELEIKCELVKATGKKKSIPIFSKC